MSITGQDMRKDQDAYEKSDVVDKVSQTLAKFGEVEDPTPDPEPVKPAEPKEPTPVEPKPAGDDDPTPKSEPKEPAEPTEPKEPGEPEKPAIPDNYYRAAIHQGWKPEQISKLFETDPEGTLKILEKTYNDVNNLSQQFAALGRKAREVEAARVQPQPQIPQPSVPKGFDVEAFKRAYGDDPAAAIAMAFQTIQSKSESQPQPQPQDRRNEWEDHVAALEQLNTFFGADDVKPFAEYYGKSKSLNWSDLTPDQYAKRQAVVNRADEILAGAELLQKGMSVREAVELAHMELTAPILHKVVRQDILKQVQKRAKGATMRPSKSKSIVVLKEGQKTEEQAVANAEARLADLRSRGM